jgi:hypothetical protein
LRHPVRILSSRSTSPEGHLASISPPVWHAHLKKEQLVAHRVGT